MVAIERPEAIVSRRLDLGGAEAGVPSRPPMLAPMPMPEPLLAELARCLWAAKLLLIAITALLLAPLLWLIISLPDSYTARATLMIDPRDRGEASLTSLVPALLGDEPAVASEMEILRSRDLMREVVEATDLVQAPGFAEIAEAAEGGEGAALDTVIDSASKSLDVARLNESRVIEVRFVAKDPELAARVVNEITGRYLVRQSEQNLAIVSQTSSWLSTRLGDLESDLAEAEQIAEAYRAASIDVVGSDSALLERQIQDMTADRAEAGGELREAQSRLSVFEQALESHGARTALSLLDQPELTQLLQRYVEAEQNVRALELRHGPDHALLQEPQQVLAALTAQLEAEAAERRDEAALRVQMARRNVESLSLAMSELQRDLTAIRGREIEQNALDREVDAARDVFTEFLKRFRETEKAPLEYAPVWLVSSASVPLQPSGPMRPVLALAGLGLSGAIAAAIVLMLGSRRENQERRIAELRSMPGVRWVRALPSPPARASKWLAQEAAAGHLQGSPRIAVLPRGPADRRRDARRGDAEPYAAAVLVRVAGQGSAIGGALQSPGRPDRAGRPGASC